MARVVGVRFKTAGKVYYFDPGELELELGDGAVVETARGLELGTVATRPREVSEEEVKTPLKKVLRKASAEDFERRRENEAKAERAFTVGQQKIEAHGLPMKLVHVDYTLDGTKIIFYFTAETRVDFRELVKDLASTFRTRIELRQIGVRDEAKLLGGLGPCGRELCCQAFLGDFVPVSIRMAKEQNLSLNPAKISGICGRLMCCLNYESQAYREAKEARRAAKAAEEAAAPATPEAEPAETVEAGQALPCAPVCPAKEAGACPHSAPRPAATEGSTAAEEGQGKKRRRRRRRPAAEKGPGSPPAGDLTQAVATQAKPVPAPAQPPEASPSRRRRRRRNPKPAGPGGEAGRPGGNREGSPGA